MREIKFRAWDLITGKMIGWGDLLKKHNLNEIFEYGYDLKLMQYTGLKDKKGKKIYEGDVVHWIDSDGNERIDYVWFFYGAFRICNSKYTLSDYLTNCLQVIGNIHENPELLEVHP